MRRTCTSKWTCISMSHRRDASRDSSTWRDWFTSRLFSFPNSLNQVHNRPRRPNSYSSCAAHFVRQDGGAISVEGRRYWKLLLLCSSLLCYANSYNGEFVFDDSEAILNNKDVTGPGKGIQANAVGQNGYKDSLWSLVENDFWGAPISSNASHKSWRPFTTFTFRLNYMWSQRDSRTYHLVNILLHAVVVLLSHEFFLVIFTESNKSAVSDSSKNASEFYDNDSNTRDYAMTNYRPNESPNCTVISAANWASLFFAVHPVHTECVSSIVGRAELLSAVFFLFSFLSYVWAVRTGKRHVLLLCAICAFLAMVSKEQGVTVLGVCFLYDSLVISKPAINRLWANVEHRRTDIRNNNTEKCASIKEPQLMAYIFRASFLTATGVLLLFIRFYIMGLSMPKFTKPDNPASFNENIIVRVINYNYYYALNAWLLLNPCWLCFDYSMGCIPLIVKWTDYRLLLIVVFWMSSIAVIRKVRNSKSSSKISLQMALSILAVTFFPVSNIPFRVGFVLAERILYLPSLGYSMIIGLAIARISASMTSRRKIYFFAAVAVTLLSLVSKSMHRSGEWKSEEALYKSGISVCPMNAKVHYNLGIILSRKGERRKSEIAYRNALRLSPQYDHALNNLGNLLKEMGQLHEAELLLQKAVQVRSDFAAAWMNLGIVQAAMKKFNESEKAYLTSLRLRKHYPDCHFNLGNMYVEEGRLQEAMHSWLTATEQQPGHAKAWINIMILLDTGNDCEEAVEFGMKALHYVADDAGFHFTLANCLGKLERFEEAQSHFMHALRLNPQSAGYWANLGVLLHRWKRYQEAEAAYKKAMELDPKSVSIARNYKLLKKEYLMMQ